MRRLIAALLMTTIAGGAMAEGTMTQADRAAFRAEVRQYLLDNPEVLMEAMDVLRARDAAAESAKEQTVLAQNAEAFFASPHDWVGGNPDGDVTIVEFIDYRCGYCRKAYSEIEELISGDGNIRFVVKEFPILGDESLLSSRFAVAVKLIHGDAAYKAAHDAMIALKGTPDEATFTQVASDLGHDPVAILDKMAAEEVTAILKGNHATADLLEITGTPTFIIGDQLIRGYIPLADMISVVEQVRKGG